MSIRTSMEDISGGPIGYLAVHGCPIAVNYGGLDGRGKKAWLRQTMTKVFFIINGFDDNSNVAGI